MSILFTVLVSETKKNLAKRNKHYNFKIPDKNLNYKVNTSVASITVASQDNRSYIQKALSTNLTFVIDLSLFILENIAFSKLEVICNMKIK